MKKFILSSVFALALIPALSNANPLEDLTRLAAAAPNLCDINQADFCQCFEDNAIYYCSPQHKPVGMCSTHMIWQGIYHRAGSLKDFCTKYRGKFPPNLSLAECEITVGHAGSNCKGRG